MKLIKDKDYIKAHNLEYTRSYIAVHEGRRKCAYIDSKGNRTIGIGHKMVNGDCIPDVLENEEIDDLFDMDLEEKMKLAKKLFPKLDTYPDYVFAAIMDGIFRGDLSGSPKTSKLINAGKWKEASIEYLNNKEYANAIKNNMLGIYKRMTENSYQFLQYSKALKE